MDILQKQFETIDSEHYGAGSVPKSRAKNCKERIKVNETIYVINVCLDDIAKPTTIDIRYLLIEHVTTTM